MKELEQRIKKYIKARGWTILKNPGSIAKSISIESAELLEVFQWGDIPLRKITQNENTMQKIREELADIFIYATEMAISLDLNIEQIMNDKLDKNEKKYPADIVNGNQEAYLRIKESYRTKKRQ